MNIEMTNTELLNAAIALRESASEAYADERMVTAIAQFRLAARLYALLGNTARTTHCGEMARAIEAEIQAIAAGEDDEAQYLAETTTSYARSL
jgi:hypothetical protein